MGVLGSAPTWADLGGRQEFFARFPPEPLSSSRTRRFVSDALDSAGYREEGLIDRLSLATSELVNNVVAHAKTDCEVRVTPETGSVYAEVLDRARERPCPAGADVDDDSGRGLILVDGIVDDWGVASLPDGPGKRVWVRIVANDGPTGSRSTGSDRPSR